MSTLEYGKIKGLGGVVCVLRSGTKIQEIRLFLCDKISPEFAIQYLKDNGMGFDSVVKKDLNYFAEHIKGVRRLGWEDIELEKVPAFRKKVYKVLFDSSAGDIFTYGWLAKKALNPRAARAVGTYMRTNPIPLLIPCHRVTSSSGKENFSIPCFNKKPSSCSEKNISRCAATIKEKIRTLETNE
ncbi:MAG: methylated-DNA--[protein]-cysteine S-methyltransferase [Pseudomonadota bacterium]